MCRSSCSLTVPIFLGVLLWACPAGSFSCIACLVISITEHESCLRHALQGLLPQALPHFLQSCQKQFVLAGWQLRVLQRLKPRCRSFVDQIAAIAGAETSEASLLTMGDDELPGVTDYVTNCVSVTCVVIGLLYMAYLNGCRHALHSCRG